MDLLGTLFDNYQLKEASKEIPLTTKTAIKLLGLREDGLLQYVVCPTCHSIYEYEDCLTTLTNEDKASKLCCFVKYPNHTQPSRRGPCNMFLLKTVQKNHLQPFLTYPYYPLHLSICRLAMRSGFLSSCEQWIQREHTIPSGHFADIYDASVWKKFHEDVLSTPYCYLLTLNVDWFQPFKHTQYSVGAIYLVLQNLPREQRFKEENIILVGVMPSPHEAN